MTCSICLDDEGELYTLPDCQHKFHVDCIMTWFRSGKNTCPLCKCCGVELDNIRMPHIQKMRLLRTYSKSNGLNSAFVQKLFKTYDRCIAKREKLLTELCDIRSMSRVEQSDISKITNDIKHMEKRIKSKRRQIVKVPFERIIIPIRKNYL